MIRRPPRRFHAALATVLLVIAQFAGAQGTRAVETSIRILYAPTNPLVANAAYGFTAKVEPEIEDATVRWTVSGALFATDLTNPNGVSQVDLVFAPGGYALLATLVGADSYDWAFSETLLVEVRPDPARLPDRFSLSADSVATVTASGDDMSVNYLQPAWPQNRLLVGASSRSTGVRMGMTLIGPDGSPLTAGVYNPADTPRQTVDGAEGSVGGCDNGASTGGFAVLGLERGNGGFPVGFTLVAEYACANHYWPRVGWLRYNDSTPIPSLSLPDASPVFDSIIEGDRGEPQAFPITNDGEVPVTLGQVALTGTNAGDWELGVDGCSGVTLAPGETCSFPLTFAPSNDGLRAATIEIPSDLPVSPRRLRIVGQALIRTAVSAPVVRPDSRYLAHGVWIEGTVTPPTQWNSVTCTMDGEQIAGSGLGPGGIAFCLTERPDDGIHEVRMYYEGSHVDGPSTSPLTSLIVDGTTATSVVIDEPQAAANTPVTVRATVGFAGDLAYPGGVVTITDQATGETIAEGPVGPDHPSLAVVRTYSPGPHHLVATYAGIAGVHDSSTGAADLAIAAPDLAGPSGSISIAGGAPVSATRAVGLSVPASDPSGVAELRLSNDGTTWTTMTYTDSPTWTLSPGDGIKTVRARWRDGAGNLSTPLSDTITLDTTGPAGACVIASNAATTTTASVTVQVSASDATTSVAHVALSNDGITWTSRAYAPDQAWTLTPGDGTKRVRVKWRDIAGNWSPVTSDTIVLDTSGPTTSAVTNRFAAAATVSAGRVPVALAWTGTDATSGIARFELDQSTDGNTWASVNPSLAGASSVRSLAPGHTYRFRVRGVDGAGNVGAWTYGTAFTVSAVQQSSSRIAYSGTWRTGSSSRYWGGSTRHSTAAGAKATVRFTGRSFCWVAPVGPTRGSAKVYVNGVLVRTVSLNASSNAFGRLVFTRSWSTSATRTIAIRVVGTSGHPRVDIDGFAWGS